MDRRRFLAAVCGVGVSLESRAQLEELLDRGQAWAEQNIDPDVLRAFQAGDLRQAEPFLLRAAERLQGEYVLDLAPLQQGARMLLPLLEGNAESQPYASWLRAHLDYFDVAEFLRRTLPSRPSAPGQAPAPPGIPTPKQQRDAWQREVGKQPAPQGAAAWAKRLKPVFHQGGCPPELVWLAEMESSFDPLAKSPAGAAGLYQLMPATARELGLKLQPKDERFVPDKNALAAATYLSRLHRQFQDWPLTLAAYNAGPGRVSDLLKRRRARTFDAIAPNLPAETQSYVPRFETILQRREGKTLNAVRMGTGK